MQTDIASLVHFLPPDGTARGDNVAKKAIEAFGETTAVSRMLIDLRLSSLIPGCSGKPTIERGCFDGEIRSPSGHHDHGAQNG